MRREVKIARSITSNPIGINIIPDPNLAGVDLYTEPMFQMIVEEGVEVVVMVGAFSKEWTKRFKDHNVKVIYRGAPTAEVTEEAIAGGADIIVATGFDEGRQVPSQVIGTFAAVPLVVDAAKGTVPVLAAGGITDERTARAAMLLGASGLFVGTAFLLSEESRLAENIKIQVINSDANDLLLYRTLPAYYRSLPGELPNKLIQLDKELAPNEQIFQASNPNSDMREGMLLGDLSKGFASFGLGISMIDKIEPVAVILDKLMKGIE